MPLTDKFRVHSDKGATSSPAGLFIRDVKEGDSTDAGAEIVLVDTGTLMLVSGTPNPDAAWRVMEAWVAPENLKAYLLAHGGSLPVLKSLMNDPDLLALPFAEQLIELFGHRVTTYGAKHPLYREFRTQAGEFLQRALNDEMPIESALEQAEQVVNQVVRSAGY